MTFTLLLRVASVRTQHPQRGCIFTGRLLDAVGNMVDATSYYVVRAPRRLLHACQVQRGQWWQVTGLARQQPVAVEGFRLTEWEVDPSAMQLMFPSGDHIVTLLAENPEFRGVGRVKAQKLWDTYRDDLYRLLDDGDVAALAQVLSADLARALVASWAQLGYGPALQWLQHSEIDVAIGRKVLAFFGAETPAKLQEDPYRLLSFCASWHTVDAFARTQFGVAEDDPRRLQGAIEEALYRIFAAGHTVASQAMVIEQLAPLLGTGAPSATWRSLVLEALSHGQRNGSYVIDARNHLHAIGPYLMEKTAAQMIAARLTRADALLANERQVGKVVAGFEAQEHMLLNTAQRRAVSLAATHAFLLVTGGAGVGKTTVLKALYQLYDVVSLPVIQMALAGRAAKRMEEATGRPATTIASFLQRVAQQGILSGPMAVVVDEASMVDIITLHRLLGALPDTARIVLVGDSAQLMPVGPGLVLHALVGVPQVPNVALTVVKRHGGSIAQAAQAIREGFWPTMPATTTAAVAFVPCAVADVAVRLRDLYADAPDTTQILTCRRLYPDGTDAINEACQQQFTRNGPALMTWSEDQQALVATGFHIGDPVLCTRNLWALGLQNGSLGKLTEIEAPPRWLFNDVGDEIGYLIGWAEWDDGIRRPLFDAMLEDLVLGYAITVHKAQGSQWPRILVAVSGNRVLDRTLLYTAVTRAQEQVILVGEIDAAKRATVAQPKAASRQVALGELLSEVLTR